MFSHLHGIILGWIRENRILPAAKTTVTQRGRWGWQVMQRIIRDYGVLFRLQSVVISAANEAWLRGIPNAAKKRKSFFVYTHRLGEHSASCPLVISNH